MAEIDINDAFDDILLSEERSVQQGYDDGYEQGKKEGNPEGFHLGYHRGSEIGAELGYYLGFAKYHLTKTDLSEKITTNLNNLVVTIEKFPKTNVEDFDILAQSDLIRAQFKKVCSLLKIDGRFPETSKLSF